MSEKNMTCPRCGGPNLKWAPHHVVGCADCGWENPEPMNLSDHCGGGTHKLYAGEAKVEPVSVHKHTTMPLTHYELPTAVTPELKGGFLTLQRRMSTYIRDTMDKRIVDAVIEEARREGMTDVFILDRKWVMDALREKAGRRQVIYSSWEITDVDHAHGQKCYHCPECGADEWRYDEPNFCPNCGVDMREEHP